MIDKERSIFMVIRRGGGRGRAEEGGATTNESGLFACNDDVADGVVRSLRIIMSVCVCVCGNIREREKKKKEERSIYCERSKIRKLDGVVTRKRDLSDF